MYHCVPLALSHPLPALAQALEKFVGDHDRWVALYDEVLRLGYVDYVSAPMLHRIDPGR